MEADEAQRQHEYYAKTASEYDDLHVSVGDEHYRALAWIADLCKARGLERVLDVGCGTGRGVSFLINNGLDAWGLDPVRALLDVAQSRHGIPEGNLLEGDAHKLPFANQSFDALCELGMLHHVRDPDTVVQEMLRVARSAVFISDGNRFGQGSRVARLVKVVLWETRLWSAVDRVKTRGRGYSWSAGDGLAYSYSVYDSLHLIRQWADEVAIVSTGQEAPGTLGGIWHPLLTASHLLLIGLRREGSTEEASEVLDRIVGGS